MLSAIRHVRSAGFIGTVLTGLAFPTLSYAALVISTDATSNVTCSGGVCSAMAANAVLNVGDVTSMLASAPLTIQSGSLAKDILIEAPFSWTSSNALTLDSYRAITVDKPVADAGPAALTIMTDDGGTGGLLSFRYKGRIHFSNTANPLIINGSLYTLIRNAGALVALVPKGSTSYFALADDYDMGTDGRYHASRIPQISSSIFEGLGNTISNLSIASSSTQVGFFGTVGRKSVVADLNIKDATITSTADDAMVGILAAAVAGGTIRNVHTSGSVSASGTDSVVGGLIGETLGSDRIFSLISNSSSSASVEIKIGYTAGGLIGGIGLTGSILQSYSTGTVVGGNDSFAGGLAGEGSGTLKDSYALGSVTTGEGGPGDPPEAAAGGLTGVEADGGVESSYSIGSLSGGKYSALGGVIGYNLNGGCDDVYWDTKKSKTNRAVGYGDDGGTSGLTTKQFKARLPDGFDPAVWAEDPKINHGYPYLIANPPPK